MSRFKVKDYVYHRNEETNHIRGYFVDEIIKVNEDETPNLKDEVILSTTDGKETLRVLLYNVFKESEITPLELIISWKDALLKEKQNLQEMIDNHNGTFDELAHSVGGHNVDDEYFDINTELGIWTIRHENGRIWISDNFEGWECDWSLDLFDLDKIFVGIIPDSCFEHLTPKGKELIISYGYDWKGYANRKLLTYSSSKKLKNSKGRDVNEKDVTYFIEHYFNNLDGINYNLFENWVNDYLL